MGQKKHPAGVVRDLFRRVSWLCSHQKRGSDCRLVRLLGLFQGIFRSVGKALASDFVPELLRASAVGWYSAVVGLLELVASVVAGLLWIMSLCLAT